MKSGYMNRETMLNDVNRKLCLMMVQLAIKLLSIFCIQELTMVAAGDGAAVHIPDAPGHHA